MTATLRLFVADSSPSSTAAQRSLRGALGTLGWSANSVTVIDIFDDPQAALNAGVLTTPALVVTRGDGGEDRYVGDLRAVDDVARFLERLV